MLEFNDAGIPAYISPFQSLIKYQSQNLTVPFIDPLPSVQKVCRILPDLALSKHVRAQPQA